MRRGGTLLAALALACLLPVALLRAQSNATLRPNPAELSLRPGEIGRVEFILENAQDVYGIDVRAAFDPAIIEVVDDDPARDGVQMTPGAFPQPDFVALVAADNSAGTLRYIATQVNPTPPASGSGVVFAVNFRARAAGRAMVTITQVEMADREGLLLAVTPGAGTVEVASAAATAITILPNETPGDVNNPATLSPTATQPQSTTAPTASPAVLPSATVAQVSPTVATGMATNPTTTETSGPDAGPATEASTPVAAATESAAIISTVAATEDTPPGLAEVAVPPASTAATATDATATTSTVIIGEAVTLPDAPTPIEKESNGPMIGGAVAILALVAILGFVWRQRRDRP